MDFVNMQLTQNFRNTVYIRFMLPLNYELKRNMYVHCTIKE